jgi:hypothetical protein
MSAKRYTEEFKLILVSCNRFPVPLGRLKIYARMTMTLSAGFRINDRRSPSICHASCFSVA